MKKVYMWKDRGRYFIQVEDEGSGRGEVLNVDRGNIEEVERRYDIKLDKIKRELDKSGKKMI